MSDNIPEMQDENIDIDECGIGIGEESPDEELPEAEGGVE